MFVVQVQHYIMTVQAQDAGKPMLSSTVTVYINVIDENDNAPVFETNSYNVDVYENSTVNMVVTTVMATDRDSGKHKILLRWCYVCACIGIFGGNTFVYPFVIVCIRLYTCFVIDK